MLHLGQDRHDPDADPIRVRPETLLRHIMALGSSGSGKTVLSKVVTEEFLLSGVPAICLDPQGDLCSLALWADDPEALAERGINPELARAFSEKVDPVVFTPASRKGIALCADPVQSDLDALQPRERVYAITGIATMLVSLLGYDLGSDDGEGLVAVLDQALNDRYRAGFFPKKLEDFSNWMQDLEEEDRVDYTKYLADKKIEQACRKLARLDVGARRMLFHEGIPLNIDLLLGRGPNAAPAPGKTRCSIIYLNTLHSQEDKDFFVAALAEQLYAWMLRNPAQTPQALFYIDEVAPFIPPTRKPACKPGLNLLFKQARKYGVACLMATQNPADVDYKAMAQFGTWAIGRLTTRQDMKKVMPTIKSLDPVNVEEIMAELPSQNAGQFVLISPDNFDQTLRMQTRWLYTSHETLDEDRIEELADERWRDRFDSLEDRLSGRGEEEEEKPRRSSREKRPDPAAPAATTPQTTAASPAEDPDLPGAPAGAGDAAPAPDWVGPTVARGSLRSHTGTITPTPVEGAAPPASKGPATAPPSPAPAPAPEPIAQLAPPAATTTAPPPAPPPPPEPERPARTPEQEKQLKLLGRRRSASAKDFAALAKVTEGSARNALKRLVVAGLAGDFKDGRTTRYWSLDTGLRPDIGLTEEVLAIVPQVDVTSAVARGREAASNKLFGLFGEDERMGRADLEYRLTLRLSFQEKVTRSLWKRIFGASHDEHLDSIYMHPRNLQVLVYTASAGISFHDRPHEYASKIDDFDGVTTFEKLKPAEIAFPEDDWLKRKPDDAVKAHFKLRYAATPRKIEPVFVPVWRLQLKRLGKGGVRLVTIDALAGQPVEW